MHTCADMEIHNGHDGHRYVIDTHRVMPPVKPEPARKGTPLFWLRVYLWMCV
jgi:hypothetical protein